MIYGDGHCAVCHSRTKVGYLMCAHHWADVPASLRRKLYAALKSWDANDLTLAELRAVQAECVEKVTGVSQQPTLEGSDEG